MPMTVSGGVEGEMPFAGVLHWSKKRMAELGIRLFLLNSIILGEGLGGSRSCVNKVIVTLRRRFAWWPVFVLVGVNRHGQLPSVLVDPVDCTGRVIHGLWLGDSVDDGCDGTTYRKVKRVAWRR